MRAAVRVRRSAPEGRFRPATLRSIAGWKLVLFWAAFSENAGFCGRVNALNARSRFAFALEILTPLPPCQAFPAAFECASIAKRSKIPSRARMEKGDTIPPAMVNGSQGGQRVRRQRHP